MEETHWMVVANGTCMKLFKFSTETRKLGKPEVTLHPESALKQKDFDTDRGGHPSHGFGHDADATSNKKIEEKKFAKEVSSYLKKGHASKEFSRLYLASSPSFLGMLREELPKDVLASIHEEINKDLTKLGESDIWKHFKSEQ